MRVFLYAFLVLSCAVPTSLVAQNLPGDEAKPPIAVGIYGNYHLTNHALNGEQLTGIANCCPDFTGLNGSSIAFGALVEFPLSNALRLNLRGGYQNLKTTLTASKTYGKGELDNNIIDINAEKRLEALVPLLTFEPELSYRLVGRLNLHAGMRAGLVMSPTYHYEERIVSTDYTFKDGSKTRHGTDGDFQDVSSLLLSAVVGASYDLPFGKNILSPEVRYALPLNTLSEGDWKVTTLHIGAAFKIPLRSTPPVQILRDTVYHRDTTVVSVKGIAASRIRIDGTAITRDTVRETGSELYRTTIAERYVLEQPAQAVLTATLGPVLAVGLDGNPVPDGKRTVEQIELADNFPLLPYVFFPEGSSDLRQTRLRLLTPDQTSAFTAAALRADNALGLYPELLNILGYRLRTMPKSTITLTGCNDNTGAEQSNMALSQARAESIRDYLTTVWGIEAKRIVVKARNLPAVPSNNTYNDGREENRRVEITGNDVLAPVAIRDFIYESSFRSLRISPGVTSDAGVKSWSMTLLQNGAVLRTFNGEGVPETLDWDVDAQKLTAANAPIVVRMEVTDNAGQKASAEQTFSFQLVTVQEKRADKRLDRQVERYFLVLFDYNRAQLNSDHRKSIQDLGARLRTRDKSRVTIHGYTDRVGTALSNEQLAQRRAELVKSTLNFPADRMTLLPVGSKVLLYDNDHPVGRFYSRTVEIVVETPVESN